MTQGDGSPQRTRRARRKKRRWGTEDGGLGKFMAHGSWGSTGFTAENAEGAERERIWVTGEM